MRWWYLVNGDGWSSICQIESYYIWSSSYPSNCRLAWSNGIIGPDEQCDDGNTLSGDGWSPSWLIESNYSWSGEPSICKKLTVQLSDQTPISSTFRAVYGIGRLINY